MSGAVDEVEDVAGLKNEPVRQKPAPAPKHSLDWVLAGFALVSLIGNLYQWNMNRSSMHLERVAPVINRIQMPVTDALLFRSLHQRKDLLFGQFPNPSFVSSRELDSAVKAAEAMQPVQKNSTLWTFVVLRNVSKYAYDTCSITLDGMARTIVAGTIVPGETRFVYLGDAAKNALRVTYRIHGASGDAEAMISPVGTSEVLLLTELSISSLGAIRFANDEERELAATKLTPASPAEPH